jgi:radical SAM superfamily enzyme YgiQ (UPF0313 family)
MHDVTVIDMCAEEYSLTDIPLLIKKYEPCLVGITCVITKWVTVRSLAKAIKTFDEDIKVVVGGANPSLYPYETLQCSDIDFVICGFGQTPLMKLCNQLDMGMYTGNIDNCYTKKSDSFNKDTSVNSYDFDQFPFPDRSKLPVNLYTVPFCPENPTTIMLSSQGCPYRCAFCNCKNNKPIRIRAPEMVVAEMEDIYNLGIRSVLFQDELFTINSARVRAICNLLIRRNVKLNWSIKSRVNCINKEDLDVMKMAGCFNIHLGIESGNDRILKLMKKDINATQIINAVAAIKEAGLTCTASFMIGYLNETEQEIMNTIEFAHSLGFANCQFFVTMANPQTELYDYLVEKGRYHDDIFQQFTLTPDSVDLSSNIASEIFSNDEMIAFLRLAYSKGNNLYSRQLFGKESL